MITLFPFQEEASQTIAGRYYAFINDLDRPHRRGYGKLPFYQSLHALTGSGKTPILADTVAQIRALSPVEPIVLWVSKAKVVVEQTLANFSDGGKYQHLIAGYQALPLRECTPEEVQAADIGLILLGTVATFNSKEKGDRLIFEVQPDQGNLSLWETLIERSTRNSVRRPLLIVYDEGHNLSDQQMEILLELRPEAIIIASATPKLPDQLAKMVNYLKENGYDDGVLRTVVRSSAVVEACLVKQQVQLGGYMTDEVVAISAMLEDHQALVEATKQEGLSFIPKCIYVCKTNIRGDELKPFSSREAPPIRIWKYLVEVRRVNPENIAVYCDLDVSSIHPLPESFTLFRGGENDYTAFIAGNYTHIIFNLSLQEGWDDPACYFAYIDKSMGSSVQIEQIIGRMLRQPGATYYSDSRLNTCGFYIHVDDTGSFRKILQEVQQRLSRDMPAVEIISTGGLERTIKFQEPRVEVELPKVFLNTEDAAEPVLAVLEEIGTIEGSPDASAVGRVASVTQVVGQETLPDDLEWTEKGQGMLVTVRWLLERLIARQYPDALGVFDRNEPRFSQRLQLGSPAAKRIERIANVVVETFLQYVQVSVFPDTPKPVAGIICDTLSSVEFKNSIHPAYSGLNKDELDCARAIDQLGWEWCRNPSNSGFALPLIEPGTKRRFFPDFIVWTKSTIWLIDPKGEHLIKSEAGKKLISVDNLPGFPALKVCLITQGEWGDDFNLKNSSGVTGWRLQGGAIHRQWAEDIDKLLRRVIKKRS